MKTPARLAAALLVATALPAIATAPAHASGGDATVRTGSCSGSADWKIKAKPDDGRLEVEAEIDSNRNGQPWAWKLKRNGNLVDRGTATTRPPSGSFEIERRTGNSAGTDTFTFRAVNKRSGQVCVARVSI